MKNLPIEVLTSVFSFLEPKDKLESMTVCKLWESIVEGTCLLETIILSREKGIRSLTDLVLSKKHLGLQAKNLIIDTYKKDSYFRLPKDVYGLLSNLEVLYLGHNTVNYLYKGKVLEACKNSIKHLVIVSHSMVPYIPNEAHTYPNLKSLSISSASLHYVSFFDLIMKAPNLTHLHLYSCWIRPDLMELIHSVLPNLTSIKFEDMNICASESFTDIVPNFLVTSFICEFDNNSSPNNVTVWLKYITEKYPNLTELILRSQSFSKWSEKSLLNHMYLLENCQQNLRMNLKKVYIHIVKIPLELTDEKGLTNDAVESISTILERNKNSLIKSLIDIENDLSPAQLNPKRECLVQQYFGFTIPMITEIILNFKDNDSLGILDLQHLVTMCPPKLESLELEYAKLAYNHEGLTQLKFLKRLRLSNVDLPEDSRIYLGIVFRNVQTLILEKCTFQDNILVMPCSHLLSLEVINDCFNPGSHLKITTLLNLETRHYTASHPKSGHEFFRKCSIPNGIHLYPPTKSKPSVHQDSCFMHLVCDSVRNVAVFP